MGVVIVGGGESIAGGLHAVQNGHAGPDAVTLFLIQLHQLLLPVHGEDLVLPAQQVAGGLADLHIEAGIAAIAVQIAEGGILGVDTLDENFFAAVVLLAAAAGQQGNGHQRCQQQAQSFLQIFHGRVLLFSIRPLDPANFLSHYYITTLA